MLPFLFSFDIHLGSLEMMEDPARRKLIEEVCGGEVPCIERCGFGALEYDEPAGRVRLDHGMCFG